MEKGYHAALGEMVEFLCTGESLATIKLIWPEGSAIPEIEATYDDGTVNICYLREGRYHFAECNTSMGYSEACGVWT